MAENIYPHNKQCENKLSYFVETTYSVYVHVSVTEITKNKGRDTKIIHYIIVCALKNIKNKVKMINPIK